MSSVPSSPQAVSSRSLLGFFLLGPGRVIYFDADTVAQGAQHFVASRYNLIAFLKPASYLDVGGSADSRSHRYESGFPFVSQNEYPLQLLLVLGIAGGSCLNRILPALFVLARCQVAPLAHGQRLDRNGQHTLL